MVTDITILLTFLAAEMPAASWLGISASVLLALMGFLMRDAYQEIKRKIHALQADNEKVARELEIERSRADKEMRAMDARINDLHINILNKLDEIKYKFNEFRK